MVEIIFLSILATGLYCRMTVWSDDTDAIGWRWGFLPLMLGIPVVWYLSLVTLPNSLFFAYGIGFIICLVCDYLNLWPLESTSSDDSHRRGTQFGVVQEVARRIRKLKLQHDIAIGEVPFPRKMEPYHLLKFGGTGSGKSVGFTHLLDAVHKRNDRAMVVDSGGIYVTRYFNPQQDRLLNPLDERGVAWSPFAEMENAWDADSLAKSMIPDAEGNSAEWNRYAQALLSAILRRCHERGEATNGKLLHYACVASADELRPLVSGLPAASLLAEGNERMLGNVRGIMGSYLSGLSYLPATDGDESFSIRDWIQHDKSGWLFLPYQDDQLDSLKHLIACWIDIASRSILSLSPDEHRRIWLSIDEAASLGRIQTLEAFLTKARKYGGCAVIGLHSISQLRALYGHDNAQTLLSCLSTWLVLRAADAETAEYLSRHIGDHEIRRIVESGGNNQQGDSRNWSEQITQERVVMASELQSLPNLNGYLRLAGHYPVCPITLKIPAKRTSGQPAFAHRKQPTASTPLNSGTQNDASVIQLDL
jgi:type IV conjugative transfer system coupling protein TraD